MSVDLSGFKGTRQKGKLRYLHLRSKLYLEFHVDFLRLLCNIVYPKKVGVFGRKETVRVLCLAKLELAFK